MERAERSSGRRANMDRQEALFASPYARDYQSLAEISRCMLHVMAETPVSDKDDDGYPVFHIQKIMTQSRYQIHKRRVYEVLHFWEALGLVRRSRTRCYYVWHGEEGYLAFRQRLQACDPATTCNEFVNSELSAKGWAHPQRLALGIYYLFERPSDLRMPPAWDKKDFWDLAVEVDEHIDVPNLERRYYDVLNVFASLSIISVSIYKSKRSCTYTWTPDTMTCQPRTDQQLRERRLQREQERVRVVAAVQALDTLPTFGVTKGALALRKKTASQAETVDEPVTATTGKPAVRPQRKRVASRKSKEQTKRAPVKRWVAKFDSEHDHKRTTRSERRRQALTGSPDNLTAVPPPLPSSVFLAAEAVNSSNNSNSNSLSSTVYSISEGEPENSTTRFACDLQAWNAFSAWANGDNTLPALFPLNDVFMQEGSAFAPVARSQ
jgi:hypothetical protein